MHVFFSGIGGTGIGPLALIAHQARFEVSGSDKQDSQYVSYLKKHGVSDINIGQTHENIAKVHAHNPIDWFVYSSAVAIENPDAPEFAFCREQNIKMSKRDEFINLILEGKKPKAHRRCRYTRQDNHDRDDHLAVQAARPAGELLCRRQDFLWGHGALRARFGIFRLRS